MPRYRRFHGDLENDTIGSQNSEDDWGLHASPRLPPPRHNLSRYILGAGRVLKVIRTSLKIINRETLDNKFYIPHRCMFDVTFQEATHKLAAEISEVHALCSECVQKDKKFYMTYEGVSLVPPPPPSTFPQVLSASQELFSDLQIIIFDKQGDIWKDIQTGISNIKMQPSRRTLLFTMEEIDDFFKQGNELTLNLAFRFYSNHCDVLSFRNFEDKIKSHLSKTLSQMKKTKEQPNMTLVSKDGHEFDCHEELLKERSSFFTDASAISHHITNGFRQYRLDIPSKAIVFLLHFLYRSEIHVKILGEAASEHVDELEQLLLVARKFQVPDLLAFFDENLIKICWEDNAPALLKLAKTYHLPTAVEDIMNTFDLHDEENGDYLLCSFGSIRLAESRNSGITDKNRKRGESSSNSEEGACSQRITPQNTFAEEANLDIEYWGGGGAPWIE